MATATRPRVENRPLAPAEKAKAEERESRGRNLLAVLGLLTLVGSSRWTHARARTGLETLVLDGRAEMADATRQFIDGAIPAGRWHARLALQLGMRHAAGSLLLLNERALPTPDRRSLAIRASGQERYLSRFASQIASGKQPLTRSAIVRAEMYADATWAVPMGVERDRMIREGYDEAYRVLGAADHCPGCREWAGFWMPIDECPEIGVMQCLSRCHCHISYRGPAGTIL